MCNGEVALNHHPPCNPLPCWSQGGHKGIALQSQHKLNPKRGAACPLHIKGLCLCLTSAALSYRLPCAPQHQQWHRYLRRAHTYYWRRHTSAHCKHIATNSNLRMIRLPRNNLLRISLAVVALSEEGSGGVKHVIHVGRGDSDPYGTRHPRHEPRRGGGAEQGGQGSF